MTYTDNGTEFLGQREHAVYRAVERLARSGRAANMSQVAAEARLSRDAAAVLAGHLKARGYLTDASGGRGAYRWRVTAKEVRALGDHVHGDPGAQCTVKNCRHPGARFLCGEKAGGWQAGQRRGLCVLPLRHQGQCEDEEGTTFKSERERHRERQAGVFFVGGEKLWPHTTGDPGCGNGWCGDHYPKQCEQPGCKGLVHANFEEESYDGYTLSTECDVCGKPED